MCGILARIHPGDAPPASDGPSSDLLRMGHRGPDGCGMLSCKLSWGTAVLGMARLKIVDQSDLQVPLTFVSLGVSLAYNGEIYNWRALREELSDGRPWLDGWQTECDAEVVARAWRAWGPAMLSRFNGMWGLVLVDHHADEVFIARDRAGEKPVYYSDQGGVLHVASEIKSLGVPLEEVRCDEVDALEYDCLSDTPLQGVYALEPGHHLHLTGDGMESSVRWWELPHSPHRKGIDRDSVIEDLAGLLTDAVRLRAASEVPVAVMLSGGLDSAIIQAVVKSDNLYCVSFPGEIDNLRFAKLASQGRQVREVTFGLDDLMDALPRVAWHLDTPATWTAVCQWFLTGAMAEDDIRVALSGEGADELFAGYARHRILWHLDRAAQDPLLATYGPTLDYLVGRKGALLGRLLDRSGGEHLPKAVDLVDRFGQGGTLVESMARIEFHTTMQVLLRMADRMTAARSIENRSPFLDHRLMEWAARLPVEYKMDTHWTKAALRDAADRLGVPRAITRNADKRGLALPWAAWTKPHSPGERGTWDRSSFARLMTDAWREAYGLMRPATSIVA